MSSSIQVKILESNQCEEWNALVAQEPSFALLQSWEWGEFKKKMGWQPFRIVVQKDGQDIAGAQLLVKPLPSRLASVAYIPRGPLGKWLDGEIVGALLPELHRIARLKKAIYLRIEPSSLFSPETDFRIKLHRFRPNPFTNQPRASLILDLNLDSDQIMSQMRKRTKEYIKYSARAGVIVRKGTRDDLQIFTQVMKFTGKREQFPSRSLSYYEQEWLTFSEKGNAILLMAFYQEQLLAVHMAFRFRDHAAYLHGGSFDNFTNLRPNYLLMWEAIQWAKKNGCRTFDLWGIPDEVGQAVADGKGPPPANRSDGLWGVYQFKSGFSKNVQYYVSAYDYVYNSFLYALITNKFFNSGIIDRFSVLLDSFRHA